MAKIEAEAVRAWFADDTSQYNRGRKKIHVCEFTRITCVPKDARSRTTLDITAPGVHRKCGRPTRDDSWNWQTGVKEFLAQRGYGSKRRFAILCPNRNVSVVNVSVVSVKPSCFEPGQRADQSVEFDRLCFRPDAGAMLAAIDVQQHLDARTFLGERRGQRANRFCVIGDHGEFCLGK